MATCTAQPIPPALLTVRQACAYLGISRSTLAGMARRRELRRTMVGRGVRFRVGELERWISAHTERR